jgi:pimeloyl-ACP methyl ester carboxylesterase
MNRSLKLPLFLILAIVSGASWGDTRNMPSADYLELGDDRLYFEMSGDGMPLVLVSGGSGMDLKQWQRVAPALADDYLVISYDPRGVGKSDMPSVRYSDAADLEALLDHLKLDRVGLIGLSSAGGFVLEFAIQYPERVSGVVAAAPFVPGFEFSQSMMDRINRFSEAAQEGRESFLDAMLDDSYFIPAPLDVSVRSIARRIMAENFDKMAGFDPALPIPLEPPLIEQIAAIESPVLLLAGELDHPEVLRRNRFLMENIPDARQKIIVQAGHNLPLENPQAFLSAANPFLQELAR